MCRPDMPGVYPGAVPERVPEYRHGAGHSLPSGGGLQVIQGDQINMAVFLQGTRKTRPFLTGPPVDSKTLNGHFPNLGQS